MQPAQLVSESATVHSGEQPARLAKPLCASKEMANDLHLPLSADHANGQLDAGSVAIKIRCSYSHFFDFENPLLSLFLKA